MRDVIPDNVFEEIAAHIRERIHHAEQGYESGASEEDTITGDLGSSLRTDRTHSLQADGYQYKWRIAYKKFLSKGRISIEKRLGADGIFQIQYEDTQTGKLVTKGLLFQAKNQWTSSDPKLALQADKMEKLLPGGAAVFSYGPRGYKACNAAIAVKSEGRPSLIETGELMRLGDYLIERFMECRSGTRGAYYDAQKKILVVPRMGNGFDEQQFVAATRFRIEVSRT
jgi:hypothetical protein